MQPSPTLLPKIIRLVTFKWRTLAGEKQQNKSTAKRHSVPAFQGTVIWGSHNLAGRKWEGEKRVVGCRKGCKGSRCLPHSSNLCLSSRGAKCCPCWLLVGSNERRHTKWYFSLSCLEQVPAESFGSCWVLCSGNFCSTECWSHCHSWMTPDPLVTMSLTRRSEGVKTRWNPSCVLLQGRKHLLTSRAAACSIWGACRAQNEFKRPQIHLEDRFHGPRVRALTVHHSAPNQPLFFHLCYSSQPRHLSVPRLSPPPSHHCPEVLERQLAVRGSGKCVGWGVRPGTAEGSQGCSHAGPSCQSHSRWGNIWFLSPKKVTSGKKDCFLQKGIKVMLIKHHACLCFVASVDPKATEVTVGQMSSLVSLRWFQ